MNIGLSRQLLSQQKQAAADDAKTQLAIGTLHLAAQHGT
jgi:hypothetical protein